MDISIFFLNKKRFWSWILVPLVIRLLLTALFAFLSRADLEELDRNKVYQKAVTVMEKAYEKGEEQIDPYRADPITPFQGWFLTAVSRNSRMAVVETSIDPTLEPVKGTKLQHNVFQVSGSAASLHDLSTFIDMMMLEPKAIITKLEINTRTQKKEDRTTEVVSFRINFERVELEAEGGEA